MERVFAEQQTSRVLAKGRLVRRLTLAMCYLDQPKMAERQFQTWASYPAEVKSRLTCIMVDDGSENYPLADVPRPDGLPDLRLYRIGTRVPWGWPRGHNLAILEAHDGWVLLTDLDHQLDADQAERALTVPLRSGCAYKPARRRADTMGRWKPHNDTVLIERDLYWKAGGKTLAFLGHYGTSSIWSRRLAMFAPIVETDAFYQVVWNLAGENLGDIPDAGVAGLGRKGSAYHVSRNPELAPLTKTAHLQAPENPMDFPWERLL